jgi:hypothetical protein
MRKFANMYKRVQKDAAVQVCSVAVCAVESFCFPYKPLKRFWLEKPETRFDFHTKEFPLT